MLRSLALSAAIATSSAVAACRGPPASPVRITVSLGGLSFSLPKDVQSLEALLVSALEHAADEVCVPMRLLEMAEGRWRDRLCDGAGSQALFARAHAYCLKGSMPAGAFACYIERSNWAASCVSG
jgi:hypothetical protein